MDGGRTTCMTLITDFLFYFFKGRFLRLAKYVNQQHFVIMLIENIVQLKYKFHL